MRIRRVVLVVALLTVGLGAWGLNRWRGAQLAVDRVIFLGFDGASPNLMEPLVAQGKLPAIRRLMEAGSYGHIKTFRPTESGILWTSVATGKTMLKHGVIDWTYVKEAGLQVPYEDPARKVKTFWEILSERGIRTGTVNWWWTYPAAPIDNGYIITDRYRLMTIIKPAPETVYPVSMFAGVRDKILRGRKASLEEMKRRGIPEWKPEDAGIPFGGSRKTLDAYPTYFAQDVSVDHASDYLWESQPVPVFSTYFRLIDVTSHFAWHFVDEQLYRRTVELENAGKLTPADVRRLDLEFARVIEPVYRFMDKIIEKYLNRMDDRTALIVCSDHGFMYSRGGYAHAEWASEAPDGVVFYIGPGVKKGYRIPDATLFDIAPTVLYTIGQPLAQDMDGGLLRGTIEDSYLKRHPISYVPTYESGKRKTGTVADGKTEMDEKILEDLQTLGYIQAPAQKPSEQPAPEPPPQKPQDGAVGPR
ncbi:MAG: alkaline phosphatase family protein [Acidobacteria bacterium]|nr:alkaline phosphatase family protein [Acidobacteriota bacterium]